MCMPGVIYLPSTVDTKMHFQAGVGENTKIVLMLLSMY